MTRYEQWPVRPAGPIWGFILTRCGFLGVTVPWRRIYVLPAYLHEGWLLRHEQAHAMQCQRDGWWVFWPKICWDYVRYGYEKSPYEIEARLYE
jgi:hypothetical protein